MSYYETIEVVAGDSKPDISLILRDANTPVDGMELDPDDPATWKPIDLTGATVRVYFRDIGGSTILDTMTCVIVPPYDNGECYMVWNPTTLNVAAGTYEGEIEITYDDGSILTIFDKMKFKVREDF